MNIKTLFRIKFTYVGEDENGEMGKRKLEVLAQCVNYTDAEALTLEIAKKNEMSKYEDYDYEITKTNLNICNMLTNNVLCEEDDLVKGLSELYFSGETDGVFPVKVKFFGNKEEKEKDVTEIYLTPGATMNAAIVYMKRFLVEKKQCKLDSFMVIGSSLDKAENIYLTPSTYDKMKEDILKDEKEE